MKLLSSLKKELVLATRSFYFYIEVLFALILLAVLLFAVPEHIHAVSKEYVCLDMPEPAAEKVIGMMLAEDTDGKTEQTVLKSNGSEYDAVLIGKEDENIYILKSEEAVRTLAENERNVGLVVSLGDDGALHYKYYLQGYETQRLRNLLSIMHNADAAALEQSFREQPVRLLSGGETGLNDRENAIPPILAFNCCLMGMFIMAAYVFLDKKEGVIRAYAVTASSVGSYLMSKIMVVLLTGAFSGLVIMMPILGFGVDYALALLLLLTCGFFGSVLGLLIASFFEDITSAFGVIFTVMMLMILPVISYFLPGWNPLWVKLLPAYPIIQGFREVITPNGSAVYALATAGGALAVGAVLFLITDRRFKKTLGV